MDAPLNLADIRREIDALDAELRALLLKRADLVGQVAASKAQSYDGGVLRPEREALQMRTLLDWQADKAPHLAKAGVVAVWREIIGMAIAQQGGLTIYASPAAMATARGYFGASLSYARSADAQAALKSAAEKNAVAVLALGEALAPGDGQAVFARLPIGENAQALCYGPAALVPLENEALVPQDDVTALVWRQAAQDGDKVLADLQGGVLVETDRAGADAKWGHYRDLGDGS